MVKNFALAFTEPDRLLNRAAVKRRTKQLNEITPQIEKNTEKIQSEARDLSKLQALRSLAKGLTSKLESALG